MLEAMNEETYAKGGWIHRGYGPFDFITDPVKEFVEHVTDPGTWHLPSDFGIDFGDVPAPIKIIGEQLDLFFDPVYDLWEDLTALPEIPELEFDPDAFEGILYSIRQMLGETTALEDATFGVQQQFKGWIKQLEDMSATEEQLNEVRIQEAAVIAKLTEDMQEDFLKPLEDIVAKGVMTDYGYQLLQLGKWYEEQEQLAIALGLGLDTLNAAYYVQMQAIEDTRKEIEEGITRRLGVLLEAQTPGAGLSSAELAVYDLTKEFVGVIEEIQGWMAETSQDFSALITDATQLYELEMEAALAQTEAAQEIQDSISSWENIVKGISSTIYDLQTSLASPATAMERMGIVKGMIDAFPEVTTPEQAEELQNLWMDYLSLAQETYQRPSSAYREIYSDMIGALEDIRDGAAGFIEVGEGDLAIITSVDQLGVSLDEIAASIALGIPVDLALTTEDFVVTIPDVTVTTEVIIPTITIPDVSVNVTIPDVDIAIDETILNAQTTILENIRANTNTIIWNTFKTAQGVGRTGTPAGYAKYGGVFTGPESGYPVMLHGTEAVVPLSNGGSAGMGKTEINLTINESRTPRETGREVVRGIEQFLRGSRGRAMMQEGAKGR